MALGSFAGGVGQGITQGRMLAIQQAYMKLQMQRQQMAQDQVKWQQDRMGQQDMARPLEALAQKVPRQAGAIGPAIEGIYNPEQAKFNPTMADQTAPAPDPMSLERPEQQPVTGKTALAPLMANAYAQAGKGAQEEFQSEQDFRRQMMMESQRTRELLAQSLIGHRGVQERQGQEKIDAANNKPAKNPLTPAELKDIQTINDFRDKAHSALALVESPYMPKGGQVRTKISEMGGQIGATLGMERGPMEDPNLNAANKYFRQQLYAAERSAGGVRMAGSPQMFEVNKTTYANPQYMNHQTLRQVATNSANAADASVEGIKDYLRMKNIPESEWGKYIREPRVSPPEEILGLKKKTPAQTMGQIPGAPGSLGVAPVPPPRGGGLASEQPGWVQ
jgi:hypothetical protein